jgi:hypothetical protein
MPSVSTSLVLARPGTPISSAWPPDRIVTRVFSITRSWPKMTVEIAFLCGANLAGDLFGRTDDRVLEFLDTVCARHIRLLSRFDDTAGCVVIPRASC